MRDQRRLQKWLRLELTVEESVRIIRWSSWTGHMICTKRGPETVCVWKLQERGMAGAEWEALSVRLSGGGQVLGH